MSYGSERGAGSRLLYRVPGPAVRGIDATL
jgi:hypothetical protein